MHDWNDVLKFLADLCDDQIVELAIDMFETSVESATEIMTDQVSADADIPSGPDTL